ncbi:hypothetical protein GOP47_0020554 [Adiantum capillus-veneris]|uniref:SURP and G-patch domain-containing protein 1-like protein n=1 Tax=Adiantum capillus-veneris TaxID=13818 RepID=A0A9D4UB01_ADICA|nr:hypothetical protein GOP47_0020554 [Adiantum capillus-veneris]
MEGANSNGLNSFPFINDGSFLERFKQLQEQKEAAKAEISACVAPSLDRRSATAKEVSLLPSGIKLTPSLQKSSVAPGGKLAFSLKPKSRSVVNPLKLGEDDDEEEDGQQALTDPQPKGRIANGGSPKEQSKDAIPSPPTDLEVKKVADKLAHFVAKNGRQFEDLTRKKNPGDTPFRFLFDVDCADYKYYNYRVGVEENSLAAESRVDAVTSSLQNQQWKRGSQQGAKYQTPASALYGGEDAHQSENYTEGNQEPASAMDSVSMMEYYMQKAAKEDMHKPYKRSRDEMPPPAFQAPSPPAKKGHHMGDYIPQEELEKFLSKCNDATAQMFNKEAAERAKIQPDNKGHKLLSKMGWKEGEGLGSGRGGRADPVEAGAVKTNNLGVGAQQPGEVNPDDDIYEQYKKRMMLGYRYRPNPLNNPRKAYY